METKYITLKIREPIEEELPKNRARNIAVKVMAFVGLFVAVCGVGTDDMRGLLISAGGVLLLLIAVLLGAGKWGD